MRWPVSWGRGFPGSTAGPEKNAMPRTILMTVFLRRFRGIPSDNVAILKV